LISGNAWRGNVARSTRSFKARRTKIYFVQAGKGGPIKIGRADDPDKRLLELQVGSPERLVTLAVFDGPAWLERACHREFSKDQGHLRGEWFKPTKRLLDFLKWWNEGRGSMCWGGEADDAEFWLPAKFEAIYQT